MRSLDRMPRMQMKPHRPQERDYAIAGKRRVRMQLFLPPGTNCGRAGWYLLPNAVSEWIGCVRMDVSPLRRVEIESIDTSKVKGQRTPPCVDRIEVAMPRRGWVGDGDALRAGDEVICLACLGPAYAGKNKNVETRKTMEVSSALYLKSLYSTLAAES